MEISFAHELTDYHVLNKSKFFMCNLTTQDISTCWLIVGCKNSKDSDNVEVIKLSHDGCLL